VADSRGRRHTPGQGWLPRFVRSASRRGASALIGPSGGPMRPQDQKNRQWRRLGDLNPEWTVSPNRISSSRTRRSERSHLGQRVPVISPEPHGTAGNCNGNCNWDSPAARGDKTRAQPRAKRPAPLQLPRHCHVRSLVGETPIRMPGSRRLGRSTTRAGTILASHRDQAMPEKGLIVGAKTSVLVYADGDAAGTAKQFLTPRSSMSSVRRRESCMRGAFLAWTSSATSS
jgi:hypothetical protein